MFYLAKLNFNYFLFDLESRIKILCLHPVFITSVSIRLEFHSFALKNAETSPGVTSKQFTKYTQVSEHDFNFFLPRIDLEDQMDLIDTTVVYTQYRVSFEGYLFGKIVF